MVIRTVSCYPTFSSLPVEDVVRGPIKKTLSFDGSPLDVSPASLDTTGTAEIPATQSDNEASADSSEEEVEEGYVFPELRYPPISKRCDTVYFEENLTPISVHGPMGVFAEEKHVIKKYGVRYIDCGPYKERDKVVAITRAGKHVVWQQAIRSCVPAAISMIALDRQKTFLAQELKYAVTSNDREITYIVQAGFEPVEHALKGLPYEKAVALQSLLLTTGPGLLHLQHPDLESHVCVLDEVSLERFSATVRDSIKGEMVTIQLFPFANWIGSTFIELAEKNSPRSSMTSSVSGNCSVDPRKRKASEPPEPAAAPKFAIPFTRTESKSSAVSAVGQNALAASVNVSSGRRSLIESYDEIDGSAPHSLNPFFKLN
jgi:hypothetical protein